MELSFSFYSDRTHIQEIKTTISNILQFPERFSSASVELSTVFFKKKKLNYFGVYSFKRLK
jgi:hypothetical protein